MSGKYEFKRSLGRPRYRWEDNIKIDLNEIGKDYFEMDSVGTGQE